MAVTTAQIRDLLNRPRGLNLGTIEEYITIRTNEITKVSRSTEYIAEDSANAISTADKEGAIKYLVCMDCLLVLIQTVPTVYPTDEQDANNIKFAAQLKSFRERAEKAVALVSGSGKAAFATDRTDTRKPSALINSTGVIRNSLRTLE